MIKSTSDWKDFLDEGKNYFYKAKHWQEKGKFNKDLIYNLVLMSMEKNIMAICLKNNKLPENHTITDLVEAFKNIAELDADLEKQLLEIEKYQNICTIDDYERKTGSIEDIDKVVRLGNEINDLVNKLL